MEITRVGENFINSFSYNGDKISNNFGLYDFLHSVSTGLIIASLFTECFYPHDSTDIKNKNEFFKKIYNVTKAYFRWETRWYEHSLSRSDSVSPKTNLRSNIAGLHTGRGSHSLCPLRASGEFEIQSKA